jgi:uncharacterized protein
MKSYLIVAASIILTGCSSTPLPHTYVLSAPADPVAGVRSEAGRPVVELPTVTLPDYLDTIDIFVRDGRNELKPSATGRWGERLSVGITHALEVSLSRRLPGFLVTHTPISGQPSRRLLVDVSAFGVQADGRCVLTARWSVSGNDSQPAAVTEQGTFVTSTAGGAGDSKGALADAAVVSAMTAAVDQLADRIATSLRRPSARPK